MVAPSRERGLKFYTHFTVATSQQGRSFAGAWIEICVFKWSITNHSRRSFAGAWIEINVIFLSCIMEDVAPSRERGLK